MGPWLVDTRNRAELDMWLDGAAPVPYRPVIMIVRGDDQPVRELLPNVLDAAKQSPTRVVLWVKDPALLTDDERSRMFRDDDAILGAVLSAEREVKGWLYRDHTEVDDAAFTFAAADPS